jgi:hypothetical protein
MPNMPGDQHPDPRYVGNRHPIGQPPRHGLRLCRTHLRSEDDPKKYRNGGENTDPQTDPDIQFQVRVKGWIDLTQQNRVKTILTLSNKKMVKSLQHHRDILLIPRSWWSHLYNTLEQDEPGWWYTVSNEMGYQGCRSCKNRIGKDHQDVDRCPECPATVRKRKNSGSKKNQGKNQKGRPEQASNRTQRSERRPIYAEPSDAPTDEDSEEVSDSVDIQIGYLCISADPRRVGVGGGEPMILNPKEIRRALTLQQTMEDQTVLILGRKRLFIMNR